MSQKKVQLLNPLSGNINVAGVITASSFVGSGEGLTGVASTDNIQTATAAKFLSDVSITGVTTVGVVTSGTSVSASHFYGDGSALTGIDATSIKDSGGNVKAQANPNGIVVTGVLTATTGSFSGNVTIGGTLTYQDVEHIDSVGIITAQQGIQVLANGLDITGVSTFKNNVLLNGTNRAYFNSATIDFLHIYDDNSSGNIVKLTGEVIVGAPTISLRGGALSERMLQATKDGSVDLYYDNSKKLETVTGGVTVTGTLTATALAGDGSALTNLPATGVSVGKVFFLGAR